MVNRGYCDEDTCVYLRERKKLLPMVLLPLSVPTVKSRTTTRLGSSITVNIRIHSGKPRLGHFPFNTLHMQGLDP